jgi:enamine deaminase RidA (YjgF/YER057c/UK114 family)
MGAEARLAELGVELGAPVPPAGRYSPVVHAGALAYCSGQVPLKDGRLLARGRVGVDATLGEARACAGQAAWNTLATLRRRFGSLDRIERLLRMTVFVAAAEDFTDHSAVADGASELFDELFGDCGRAARSAVGVASLPLGATVEIETTWKLHATGGATP